MTTVTTTPPKTGLILLLLCAAQFMVVLDIAIVNVALPSIQVDLAMSQDSLQWVVIAYGLMLGGFLLLGGRLADLLGRKRVLISGLAVFTAASLLAGLAESAELLIAARAIQGFGAAMIPPAALSILAITFEEGAARNRALGLFGAVAGISATVGVIASGLLTDGPGWRAIFLLNVPIGIVLIAMTARLLRGEARDDSGEPFDIAGAVTLTGSILLVVYALSQGPDDGWVAWSTLALFAGAAALMGAFLAIESTSREPLIPGIAVRNRTLIAANLSALFTFSTFFALIFVGTLLLQQVLGYSATKTGVAWVATSGISFFAAGLTGSKLAAVLGPRTLLIGGQGLLAVAMLLLARVPADADYWTDLLPAFLLAGIAVGAAAPAIQIAALAGVEERLTGLASGLVETSREIGGAIGVAVVATVLTSQAGIEGFRAAFVALAAIAALGAIAAAARFPRHDRATIDAGAA
ncbi:MFS transporter [Nocardioides sp. HM23]|uniref:MFS transporter n=1 Tax=Nocardioides bizhenqiangii TaxID=3095076 RepID=UPI002ACAEDAE|nr:MFS transporter [Nocardioides sp. HM23]MDZ5620380.1 MFS transporter [Nocardioides sp. HM23]